jgi:alpha-glucan phosphorylase-like protein
MAPDLLRLLHPDALTLGFARRFATYKRAALLFEDPDRAAALFNDPRRPLQIVFAGKAHPRDDGGKAVIQKIHNLSHDPRFAGKILFIENYNIQIARYLVSGCDIWLNNPRRPLEASGTSGQKTAVHGCLNLSIMDGWWREGYDGTNGFAIGEDSHPDHVEEQDRQDSRNLYDVLENQVIPEFYDRDEMNIPRKWIQRIRRAMVTLIPVFNTDRMVAEYTNKYYIDPNKS